MRFIITGGAGFLGRKLARAILERGTLAGADGAQTSVTGLVLFDTVLPDDFGGRAETLTGDIADAATVRGLVGGEAASVFHLAAIVSAGAEEDFERTVTGSTWTARATCSKPAARWRARRASSSPPPSRSMAATCRRRSRTIPRRCRRPPTASRSWSANSWSTTTPARAISTAGRCACRRSWSGPRPTGRPRPGPVRSFASLCRAGTMTARSSPMSRWPACRPGARSTLLSPPTTCPATGSASGARCCCPASGRRRRTWPRPWRATPATGDWAQSAGNRTRRP